MAALRAHILLLLRPMHFLQFSFLSHQHLNTSQVRGYSQVLPLDKEARPLTGHLHGSPPRWPPVGLHPAPGPSPSPAKMAFQTPAGLRPLSSGLHQKAHPPQPPDPHPHLLLSIPLQPMHPAPLAPSLTLLPLTMSGRNWFLINIC